MEIVSEGPTRRHALTLLGASIALPALAAGEDTPSYVTRVALGSFLSQDSPRQGIWEGFIRYKPHVTLFAGDMVMGNLREGRPVAEGELLATMRDAYEKLTGIPNLERLRSRSRIFAIWNGHDYARPGMGEEFALKNEVKALFLNSWKAPDDDQRRARDGLYMADIIGPKDMRLQVIMLDTRFFRSALKPAPNGGKDRYLPDDDPAKTMLGAAQWQWLGEELKRPAELRLIVSPIPILAEGNGERWSLLPRERARLLRLIGDSRAAGVVLLSGGQRYAAAYREADSLPYALTELSSSGLSESLLATREQAVNQLGPPYGDLNFGTIDIDWWRGALTLQLRASNGEVMRALELKLDDLRARTP